MGATHRRIVWEHEQGADWLRTWWEDEFHQPSAGNPLWENVSTVEHYECYIRRSLAKGLKVYVDGAGNLVEVKNGMREVERVVMKYTGNELADARGRRMALGLPLKG